MRKVTIQYRPFRWLKFTRHIIGNFPSKWEETNPKQLIAIACLTKQTISDVQFLSIMTNLSKRTIKKLDDYQRFQLINLFDTFQSDKPYNDFIIQKLDCKQTILHAPKAKLHNLSFGQFIFIDTHFTNYQESSDTTDLNKFIAAAYLPFGQRFAEHIIDINHKSVDNLDLLTKEAVVINYHLIRDWLTQVYPLVFSSHQDSTSEVSEDVKKQKPKKRTDSNSWIKVYENIVGDDIVNENKYADLPIHTILRFLSNKIKQARKK
ncbi:MAG: hypothetical protein HQ522_03770 [Bacteroidetes bacterium]|nr:hypothetical protein [Bacteroidota bacterium]